MTRRDEEEREREDLEFVSHPYKWPRWPLLPVKQRNGDPHGKDYCGVLLESVTTEPAVYLSNMYSLPADFNDVPKKQYSSVEELVKEWMVD